jgi:cob(I)alamin adenosyltransferase
MMMMNTVVRRVMMSSSSVKRVKVYTRTGDKGGSSLFNGERSSKSSLVFEVLGGVDELNCHIGRASDEARRSENGLCDVLNATQSVLLDLGSHIATPPLRSSERRVARVNADFGAHVEWIERCIDVVDGANEPLRNFILPGGATSLHLARAVCRRAERRLVELAEANGEHGGVDDSALRLLNRLSDFLFVAARYATHHIGVAETVYKSTTDVNTLPLPSVVEH